MLVCCIATVCSAAPPDKEDQLRKEVAELRAQLAAKETELKKLEAVTVVPFLFSEELKVGTVGPIGYEPAKGQPSRAITEFGVVKVIDKDRLLTHAPSRLFLSSATGTQVHSYGTFVLRYPTAGLKAAGSVKLGTQLFRVRGTVTIGKDTYLVEPYAPPAK